jgi:SAM-dependent methyltransferase
MEFDGPYSDYWRSTVRNSIDGTKIAGASEIRNYLRNVPIQRSDYVLDLGCSYGRMFELLASYSDHVFGVDPESSALAQARQFGYQDLLEGSAENTNMPSHFFDLVFSWAVFDVVNQTEGLKEVNRILKVGGTILFTGKNDDYYPDDKLAFLAEKNAFLKGFPNRFTNLSTMLKHFPQLGFILKHLYLFPRRGDIGLGQFEDRTETKNTTLRGYEYLIICSKKSDIDYKQNLKIGALDLPSSRTAINLGQKQGFSDYRDYFISLGLDQK